MPTRAHVRATIHGRNHSHAILAKQLLDEPPHVLATGGGAFMNDETRKLILDRTTAVWLKADVDLLARRVSRKTDRPLLHGRDPREVLEQLAKVREPVYALAHVTVDSDETPHGVTVQSVLDALTARLAVEPRP